MNKSLIRAAGIALLMVVALLLSSPVLASPECTTEPESKWLTEQAMKDKIAELGYVNIKIFKKTKSGCYEIYGHTKDGRKAEVYFNPVDGSVVKENID
jgi:hypothetical protein